jgi:DNA replicative helicase MCM subunit Mcm2 (Cdc46/Mcm family)
MLHTAGGANGVEKYSSNYTENDLDTVKMIASEPSPFELIVYSLCPGIFGHELVKAGMCVCMFVYMWMYSRALLHCVLAQTTAV